MEKEKSLERRMYFFVPYNISDIQKAIQAGHASLEYAFQYGKTAEFKDFVKNWKTWIILDGGTTNERRDEISGLSEGSLNQIADELSAYNVPFSCFNEPDLNDALTAVCFIACEKVWNKKDYPDFVDYLFDVKMYPAAREEVDPSVIVKLKMLDKQGQRDAFPEYYAEWMAFLGGTKNVFLRELITGKRLA